MSEQLATLEKALLEMRRSRVGGRLKPHKLLMLLAVMDLFDAGALRENRVPYDPGLAEHFGVYFQAIARKGDWCQPAPPFFHLRSGGFWRHKPIEGREAEYAALKTSGGGSKRILDNIEYAYLDDDAFAVFFDPEGRKALRRFILETFFPAEERQKLNSVMEEQARINRYESVLESQPQRVRELAASDVYTRNAAFSRMIRRIYDYQCAMCGLRIMAPDGGSILNLV